MANRKQLQGALQKTYNRILFATEILSPVFGEKLKLNIKANAAPEPLTAIDKQIIDQVTIYGYINLEDDTEVICYEVLLQPTVHVEQSKVAIQRYVRRLLLAGQVALVNFIAPQNKNAWRLSLIAKDTKHSEKGVEETTTNNKRYTYLLGPGETCKTAAERFETLSFEKDVTFNALVKAFSVEKLSDSFFQEYKYVHYANFVEHIVGEKLVRKGKEFSWVVTGTPSAFYVQAFTPGRTEKEAKAEARNFVKKLLARIVFLYFVQKKGWLGATDTAYRDGKPDFIKELFEQSGANETFYSNWLYVLFFETLNQKRDGDNFTMPDGSRVKIPFLNGGLFDLEEHDKYILTLNPLLFSNPDNTEDPKQRGFLDFLNSYNFTIFEDGPDEQTVAVDPEMLGHIFENLLEDNNDKGTFYTPKSIVHYMCQESLIEYLTTQLSKEYTVYQKVGDNQVELFGNETRKGQLELMSEVGDRSLDRKDVEQIVIQKDISRLTQEQLKHIDGLLDAVKICDPAIGSGAFPMGLLQEIYTIKEAIAFFTKKEWKPAAVKENIIQNSIYGVDIEKGAVDIARLRFWLSLVVDEHEPKPLPNLDYKIVVGNSLVSKFEGEVINIDWEVKEGTQGDLFGSENVARRHDLLYNISKKQHAYFLPENKLKKSLTVEIRNLKLELLINQLEEMVKTLGIETQPIEKGKKAKEKLQRYLQTQGWKQSIAKLQKLKNQPNKPFTHFDWKLDFPEVLNPNLIKSNAGFDVVIGNPPYVQLQKMGKEADLLQQAGYDTFTRTGDIYCLFYELGISILKSGGMLAFITSNKWMRAAYGESMRKFFLEKTNPLQLVDFGGYQVFDATVDTNILITQKAPCQYKTQTCVLGKQFNEINNLSNYFRQKSEITSSFNSESSWAVLSPIEASIKLKIEKAGVPLKDWNINIYRGVLTGYNEAFIIDSDTKNRLIGLDPKNAEIIRPILKGRDIKKYKAKFNNLWIIFTRRGINIGDYPAIEAHLKNYYSLLKPKSNGDLIGRKTGKYKWYEIQDNVSYFKDFEKEKIIWLELTDTPKFSYDVKKYFVEATAFFMTGEKLKFLTAFLNSKLSEWYFDKITTSTGVGTNRWKKIYIENLPIPKIDGKLLSYIESKVEEIISRKRIKEPIYGLEREIDNILFEFYDMSETERNLVLKV